MAEKKKKPGFWGKVGNIAKGTGKDALKIITRTDAIGDGPGQISQKTIQERKEKREAGEMPYQKAVKKREAKKNPPKPASKPASKPKGKKRALMTKAERKAADRQKRTARAKAWRENRAKKKANKTKASKVTDDRFLRNIK
jgi:hypothetical protein